VPAGSSKNQSRRRKAEEEKPKKKRKILPTMKGISKPAKPQLRPVRPTL